MTGATPQELAGKLQERHGLTVCRSPGYVAQHWFQVLDKHGEPIYEVRALSRANDSGYRWGPRRILVELNGEPAETPSEPEPQTNEQLWGRFDETRSPFDDPPVDDTERRIIKRLKVVRGGAE